MQSAVIGNGPSDQSQFLILETEPQIGDLIVVMASVSSSAEGVATQIAVQNGIGDDFEQIDTGSFVKFGINVVVRTYFKIATNTNDTIMMIPDQECKSTIAALVFRGIEPITTLASYANNGSDVSASLMTSSAFTPVANTIVVGTFCGIGEPDTITPEIGYTLEVNHFTGAIDSSDMSVFMTYKLDGGSEDEATATWNTTEQAYTASAITFNVIP